MHNPDLEEFSSRKKIFKMKQIEVVMKQRAEEPDRGDLLCDLRGDRLFWNKNHRELPL